jgi:hypothetical protein
MRKRIAAIATCAAALAAPVAAQGSPTSVVPEHHPAYEKRYLEVRHKLVKRLGLREAGRNIVSDGYREKDGDVHPAHQGRDRRVDQAHGCFAEPARAGTDYGDEHDDIHHELLEWRRLLVDRRM